MKKKRKAKPVMAWLLVTRRGRMVIAEMAHRRGSLKDCGFPSDRIAKVRITEV